MDKSSVLLLLFLLMLLILPLFPTFVLGGVMNSTYSNFSVTNVTSFNWTTSNVTIHSFNNSIQMNIDNKTTGIYPEYSQTSGVSGDYSSSEWDTCFPLYSSIGSTNISFTVQHQNGSYINYTSVLNSGEEENFTLSIHPFCPPGKYYGYFNVTRVGNSTDRVKVYTTINIPISLNNTFNTTSNTAYFKGTVSLNDSYHSYYFNTSELTENITGLTITLTELSDDIDIFVFNGSGTLMGKSIEKSTSDEQIIDLSLPITPDMWEARVYGNVSSDKGYRGYLYFSTLNITNINSPDQIVSSLDFGDLDPNSTDSENFTLKNEDNRVLLDVYEYSEIYHVDTWGQENTGKDFTTFLVPNFTQKVKVKINWTVESGKNVTDWNLYLTDPSGSLIGSSTDKFLNSNMTNATREEFIVFTGPFSSVNEGFWNISVRNQTNSTIPLSYYTLTAYIWMNESEWISTNYTDFDFNSSVYTTNNSYNVSMNLTMPEAKVLDGKYEGFLKYNSSEGWNTKLPISFNVSAGTLVINNSINTVTRKLSDNIGFNRVGANALTMNITFNNTGSYPIYYANDTSNYTLTLGNSNISFTVDDWPSNPINSGSSGTINLTISINTTLTNNSIGIYKGSIFFNTTNTTLNSSSYPYKTFNLTLEVNLTDALDVRIDGIRTTDSDVMIETPSGIENITIVARVYLINGTQLTDPGQEEGIEDLYIENFTTAWMNETNITSNGYDLTNINQESNPGQTTWLCYGSPVKCYVNVTTTANMIGGRYKVSLIVQWNTSESVLTGVESNESLVVNDTGFYLRSISLPTTLVEDGPAKAFSVNVTNYGPLGTAGTTETEAINFTENCDEISNANGSAYINKPVDIGAYNGVGITKTWYYKGDEDGSCSYTIEITTGTAFNSLSDKSISISNVTATTTTTISAEDGGDGTTGTTTTTVPPSAVYLNITSYPSTVSVEQGSNKTESVKVKNINETLDQSVKLEVFGIEEGWYEITPSTSILITTESEYTYFVIFSIPENQTVDDYSGMFKASSSYDSVNKDFTLRVTPGAEMKEEISINITHCKSEMLSLEEQINQSKKQGYNVSEAEALLSQLKEKISQAESYIAEDDYRSAYDLLDDIETLLNQTQTALLEANPTLREGWWSWGKWVVIVIVGVGVAFIVYMFWPTPVSFKPEKKYPQKIEEERVKDKIVKHFETLKEKWRNLRKKKKEQKYAYGEKRQ